MAFACSLCDRTVKPKSHNILFLLKKVTDFPTDVSNAFPVPMQAVQSIKFDYRAKPLRFCDRI